MKLPCLLASLACSTSPVALAQVVAKPAPQARTDVILVTDETAAQVKNSVLQELTLQPDGLGNLIDQLTTVFTALAEQGGPAEFRMPTVIYGPGVREAKVAAPLRLTGLRQMRAVDALALLATAGGCRIAPIYSVPSSAAEEVPHVIGYYLQSVAWVIDQSKAANAKGDVPADDDRIAGVGLALSSKDGNIVVEEVVPGSPAARVGVIKPGDRVLRVSEIDTSAYAVPALLKELEKTRETLGEDHPTVRSLKERLEPLQRRASEGIEVTGLPLMKVVELVRGAPGSKVRLTLITPTEKDPITHLTTLVREKLPFSASGMVPKVAVFKDGTLTLNDPPTGTFKALPAPNQYGAIVKANPNVEIIADPHAAPPQAAGTSIAPPSPIVHDFVAVLGSSAPAAPSPYTGVTVLAPVVRIYALGSILRGGDPGEDAPQEEELKQLVAEALETAGLSGSPGPKLYIHAKSRVLVAKATAEAQEIISQIVNALKENQNQPTLPAKP